MKVAGLDIGSRTIKCAILDDAHILDYCIVDTGIDPFKNAHSILARYTYDTVVATGYGRYLAQTHLNCPVVTEIKAYALGANHIFPECRTVIDIGGQDSKIIRIDNGRVQDFEMNDRCAAGTGRFLEVMAKTLGYAIEEFGSEALKASESTTINSMCTVFAESEVISLISQGKNVRSISLGLHKSIIDRLMALIGRIGYDDPVVFAGGVAKNPCMCALLEKQIRKKILIPDEPQIVGAIGAALAAHE